MSETFIKVENLSFSYDTDEASKAIPAVDDISLEIKKGSSLSADDRRELYKTVDHRLYSDVNYPLFELIADTFEGTL